MQLFSCLFYLDILFRPFTFTGTAINRDNNNLTEVVPIAIEKLKLQPIIQPYFSMILARN